MLLRWAESSSAGRTVTFQLSEDSENHPFRDYSLKSGKRSGQRFAAILVEIGDDDQPVEPDQNLVQQAGIMCRDPMFWRWISERDFVVVSNENAARHWLCQQCGIQSRAELANDDDAAIAFADMRFRFSQYRDTVLNPL